MNSKQTTILEFLAHTELKMFQDFIKNHWHKNHIFAKESSVFNWQHKGSKQYHYMLAKQNGIIVGIHGVIPLYLYDDFLPKDQIFIALWRVLEGKGIGIGLRMIKKIQEHYQPKFMAGLPMDSRVIPFYEQLGFECERMSHYVLFSPYINKFKISKPPKCLAFNNDKKNHPFYLNKLTKKSFEHLETSILYSHQTPLKSDRYLLNRYFNHPLYDYEIYSISNDDIVLALCVIRSIFIEDSVVIHIVDYIGSNENFPLIKYLSLFLLKKHNAEFIDIYSYGLPEKFIYSAGFLNRREDDNLVVPCHFEPFEKENHDLICGYFTSQIKIPVRMFKGDGDADRPSMI
jgi:hypothetical protein